MTDKPLTANRVWAANADPAFIADPGETKTGIGWLEEIPPVETWNHELNRTSAFIAHANENGIALWDNVTPYPANAIVKAANGVAYVSVSNANTNNDPLTSGEWRRQTTINPFGHQTRLIASRCLSTKYPENSLPGVYAASDAGFFGCHCDVRATSDNQWVLMRDATLDRTTDGTGNVDASTLAQVTALNAGSSFNDYFSDATVPSVRRFLDACKERSLFPVIQVQGTGYSNAELRVLFDEIAVNHSHGEFLVMTDSLPVITQIRTFNPLIPLLFDNTLYSNAAVDNCVVAGNCLLAVSDNDAAIPDTTRAIEAGVPIVRRDVNQRSEITQKANGIAANITEGVF